jgi:type IV pilus assembly protein PilX
MKNSIRRLPARRARQRGIVLIAALAVLLMLTFLSVGMFRSFGLEERITGNSREKLHAFYAAQSTLQYAETWLQANGNSSGSACTAPSTTATVCNSASYPGAFTLATTNWSSSGPGTQYGTPYSPPEITSNASTTAISATQAAASNPQFLITYLGTDPSTTGANLYLVTAIGFGANSNAVSVLQGVYSVGQGVQCKSKPC